MITTDPESPAMSSMHRTISGDVLVQHLTEDAMLIDRGLVEQHGRSARTLVKEGPIRVTMIALDANGTLPAHSTAGPISVQLLEGDITFTAAGQEYPLQMRDLLVISANVEHSAKSAKGGAFLLTVVHPASADVGATTSGA
jgi:quercetin dioxygenase-like cupin family protein